MLDEVRQPLDFSPAPLLRATLVRLTPEEHLLMLTAHHIISDGWSNGLLVRELALFYEAFRKSAPEPLPPLAIQYADYVLWQEGWLKTDAFQKQLHFWKETLTGELPVLDFPADFARRAGPDSGAILETLLLPMELSDALKKFCREEGVTLFMVLYSAYVVLLRRYTGQEQFLVGTTAANRSKPELEELIGLFANLLLFRSDVPDGITFRDFLSCQRELLLGGFANQEAPFELVLEQWQQEQKGGERKTLLQTHFLFQKAFMQPTASGDLAIQPVPSVSPGNTFEFAFGIVERLSEGIRLQMEYRTSLFRGATVRRLLRHFQALLESIVARPEMSVDELSLFAAGEREELEAATQSASTEANRSAFDPAVTVAELERDLERHFEKRSRTFHRADEPPARNIPDRARFTAASPARRNSGRSLPRASRGGTLRPPGRRSRSWAGGLTLTGSTGENRFHRPQRRGRRHRTLGAAGRCGHAPGISAQSPREIGSASRVRRARFHPGFHAREPA